MTYPVIAIEGIDGSGKTTLRKGLYRYHLECELPTPLCMLTCNYLDVESAKTILDFKAGITLENERILGALLQDKICSSRLIDTARKDRPVILDRWIISDATRLGAQRGLQPCEVIETFTQQGEIAIPNLVFVIDVDPSVAVERAKSRRGEASNVQWDNLPMQKRALMTQQESVDYCIAHWRSTAFFRINATDGAPAVLSAAWESLAAWHNEQRE